MEPADRPTPLPHPDLIVAAVTGAAAYTWLASTQGASPLYVGGTAVLAAVLVMAPTAVATVYLNERSTTDTRGLGYSLAVVLPSFYATYQGRLSALVPSAYTVLPPVVPGGPMNLVGAVLGPETRHVQMMPLTTLKENP